MFWVNQMSYERFAATLCAVAMYNPKGIASNETVETRY